jgi:hypothetical protein
MKTLAAVLAAIAIVLTTVAAWATHVIVCINSSAWILLVVGIVVPPIGLLHGVGIWFGWIA